MKKLNILLLVFIVLTTVRHVNAQQGNKQNVFDKANNTLNKASNLIAVFQPYLLKSRELFFDGKQLVSDAKNAVKNASNGDPGYNNQYSPGVPSSTAGSASQGGNSNPPAGYDQSNQSSSNNQYSSGNGNQPNQSGSGYNNNQVNGNNNTGSGNPGYGQNYLPGQSLPINNTATVNNDGTGNWGNQNNGLYGNCLDVMTGTVMGMGEAAQSPTSVDLLFFAPADGQNTYYIMTPGFAKNNSTAGYMTEHVSEQVLQWTDVNESEVALTRLTVGQFNQVQNNSQIQNAVRNAQGYAGYYSAVGQKLDGQVFAVKLQMDNREVYALVAIIKQIGTSGSNGYLKIKIKSTGIDANRDGTVDANAYQRQ